MSSSEIPTPRASGSFAHLYARAISVALDLEHHVEELERRAIAASNPHDLAALDIGAAKAIRVRVRSGRVKSQELRHLAARFAMWPTAPAEVVALERIELPEELERVVEAARELMAPIDGGE